MILYPLFSSLHPVFAPAPQDPKHCNHSAPTPKPHILQSHTNCDDPYLSCFYQRDLSLPYFGVHNPLQCGEKYIPVAGTEKPGSCPWQCVLESPFFTLSLDLLICKTVSAPACHSPSVHAVTPWKACSSGPEEQCDFQDRSHSLHPVAEALGHREAQDQRAAAWFRPLWAALWLTPLSRVSSSQSPCLWAIWAP